MSTDKQRATKRPGMIPGLARSPWASRAILALVPLTILAGTFFSAWGQLRLEKHLRERVEAQWSAFSADMLQAGSLPGTTQAIDRLVDDAFAPTYSGISEFLDWHYSFLGQATQVMLWVSGGLEEELGSRLVGGLVEPIGAIPDSIARVMRNEVLTELDRWFGNDLASLPVALRPEYERLLQPIRESTRSRLMVTVAPATIASAVTGAGTVVGTRALANRVAQRLSSRVALRLSSRVGLQSVGRLLATGLSVAVFLAIDKLFREVDEWLNRDDFEADLTALIDVERAELKSALTDAIEEIKPRFLGDFTPSEL